ncbi:MAG: glycosyltransferase family 4 protein [Candidatus Promineifilaceae bacterium]
MIYVDISAAVHNLAGLGRYCERVALNVAAQQPDRTALFYNQGAGGKLPASLSHLPRKHIRAGYKPWRMSVLMAHHARISFNKLVPDAELFHSTEHLLFPLRNVPTVLTIHDLIFKLFPEHHKRLNYWFLNWAVPIFAARASHIIAVSKASKRDVVREYGINPAKISVVYEAADNNFQPPPQAQIDAVRQKYQLPEQFLLHLATIEPRKNLSRLVDALKIVRRNRPNLQLRLIGNKGWLYDDFFAKLARENLQDIVKPLGWVPDEDLPAVIAAASLAVQPSLYEGFGLPILEHMGSGQVVAASHAASHPEVGGEAAAYFDPHNVEEMAAVIGRILNSPDEYQTRRTLGLQQAAKFSWQRTARETIAIYDQLLAGR